MNSINIDRQAAFEEAVERSQQNDMKQHADKLIQGFQKLNDSHAKRAIWELFQNAIDLSENAEIEIQLIDNSLKFKHNGHPFDHNTLNCLIKQVSSKSAESNDEEVGQYGTGFITTHSFGRKILITGSLKQGGLFISLNKFEIDRTFLTAPELINALVRQQNMVFDLIKKGDLSTEQSAFTEFTYITESVSQKEDAVRAITLIPKILPYVMVLNKKLNKVTTIDETNFRTVYQKIKAASFQHGNIIESKISINEVEKKIYSIEDNENGITVILPIEDLHNAFLFDQQLSKLFLYYPLIGTENFGINFLIHSSKFMPTEQRDGIHLKSKNEQMQINEEENRRIIAKASQMIFDFAYNFSSKIANPIYLAKINFNINSSDNPLQNEYFKELKLNWVEKFKTFSIVETEQGNIKVSEAVFFNLEFFQDELYFDSIYSLVKQFWQNIPLKDLTRKWTNLVDEWNIESIKYIKIQDLINKIQGEEKLNIFIENDLMTFYAYLIKQSKGDLFLNYKLLPNVKGEFRKLVELNLPVNMNSVLLNIADVILPEIPKRHIHPNFKFDFTLNHYNRKNYSSEINEGIEKAIQANIISEELLEAILNYCKINSTADSTSKPSEMIKLICHYYYQNSDLEVIPLVKEDELDIRPSQKRVIKFFLNDVAKKEKLWVTENLYFISKFLSIGVEYQDYEEIFLSAHVYPNQLNELCGQSNLKIDDKIEEEIKDLYDKVVKPNMLIRANLINLDFSTLLKNKDKINNSFLTQKIENSFSNNNEYANINDHPFKKDILNIINKITTNSSWGTLFPILNSKRANIILDTVTDEEIKDNVFSIVMLGTEKINLLGELIKNKDFEQIINLGTEALINEKQKKADFQHKHTIGIHIEKILREGLEKILSQDIEVVNVQNGQDIIIKMAGHPVFYIEVKSKWDINNPIRMSKNQTLQAYEQKENYALCSINMTKYTGNDKYNIKNVEDISDLIHFNKDIGEQVEHLIGIITQTEETETIHLDGDYRTYIPQKYINSGISLKEFEIFLIKYLEEIKVPAI